MAKVLILTESIGGNGHLLAARSIGKALKQLDSTVEIKLLNGLSLVSRHLENTIRHAYIQTLRIAPQLWGQAYNQERKWSTLFQMPLGAVIANYLQEAIKREDPDVVVCTHAFCLSAAAKLKKNGSYRLGAAITDFDVNGFWMHEEVDFYIVAHEDIGAKIDKDGYSHAVIVTTGIPIDPLYSEVCKQSRQHMRQKLGLHQSQPTLLMMGGGLGLGPIDRMIGKLVDNFINDVQIIVVTGRNEALQKRCKQLYGSHSNIHVLGYVEALAYYVAAADFIVTKPGGLTSSEALAMGLPIIVTNPIPGQEERNSRFLLRHRVALRVNNPHDVSRYVRPFIDDANFYEQFSGRARRVGKPESAKHAAALILDMIDRTNKRSPHHVVYE